MLAEPEHIRIGVVKYHGRLLGCSGTFIGVQLRQKVNMPVYPKVCCFSRGKKLDALHLLFYPPTEFKEIPSPDLVCRILGMRACRRRDHSRSS